MKKNTLSYWEGRFQIHTQIIGPKLKLDIKLKNSILKSISNNFTDLEEKLIFEKWWT